MIKVEENYTTEFYYLSLLWKYDHLKVQPCYAFLCGQYLSLEQGRVGQKVTGGVVTERISESM